MLTTLFKPAHTVMLKKLELTGGKAALSFSDLMLILSVALPVITAIAVFLFLRHASVKRKFIMYFSTMLIFIASTLFVFSDLSGFISLFGIRLDGMSADFLGLLGLITTVIFGGFLFGIDLLVCSNGIMKKPGRIFGLVITLLFFVAQSLILFYLLASKSAGAGTCISIDYIGKAGQAASLDIGFDLISVAGLVLYVILMFFSFIENKTRTEIRDDDIEELERLSMGNTRDAVAGCEKCCAVCEYAQKLSGFENKVLCDKKGVTSAEYRCRSFVYDPMKRPVSKATNSSEEK